MADERSPYSLSDLITGAPGEETEGQEQRSTLTDSNYHAYTESRRAGAAPEPSPALPGPWSETEAEEPTLTAGVTQELADKTQGFVGQAALKFNSTMWRYAGALSNVLPDSVGVPIREIAAQRERQAAAPEVQAETTSEKVGGALGRAAPIIAGGAAAAPAVGSGLAASTGLSALDGALASRPDERFAAIFDTYPGAIAPVMEWLQGDVNDPEAEVRLKSALDGALGNMVAAGVFGAFKDVIKGGPWTKLAVRSFVNNLLSGLPTHIANVSMTSLNAGFVTATRAMARGAIEGVGPGVQMLQDYAVGARKSIAELINIGALRVRMREARALLGKGEVAGANNAFWDALAQNPVSKALTGQAQHVGKFSEGQITGADLFDNPIAQRGANVVIGILDAPTNTLAAEDTVARTIAEGAATREYSARVARQLGLPPEEAETFIEKMRWFRRNIDDAAPDDFAQVARIVGLDADMQGKLVALQQARQAAAAVRTAAAGPTRAATGAANDVIQGAREEMEVLASFGKKYVKDFIKQVDEFGAEVTWQRELTFGKLSAAMKRLTQLHPAIQTQMPFIRTTQNLLDFLYTYGIETPVSGVLGAFSKGPTAAAIRAGGPAREAAVARLVGSSMLFSGAAGLYLTGAFSGRGPRNYQERVALEATGVKSDTLRVFNDETGKYERIQYSRFNPFGAFIGAVADAVDIIVHQENLDTAGQMSAELVAAFADRATSQWYMESFFTFLSDMFRGMKTSDPAETWGRALRKNVVGTVENLVPFSSMLRNTRGTEGEFIRQPDMQGDFLDEIVSRWSITLDPTGSQLGGAQGPPRRDGVGEVMFYHAGWGPGTLTMFPSQIEGTDPMDVAFRDLANKGFGVAADPYAFRSVGSAAERVDLTAQETDELTVLAYGRGGVRDVSLREELNVLTADPAFLAQPPEAQKAQIELVMRERRVEAKREYQYNTPRVASELERLKLETEKKKEQQQGPGTGMGGLFGSLLGQQPKP